MPNVREHLNHLVDLASRREARAALVRELSDLLLDWPADYPLAMRAPFEQLLERAAREIEPAARADLATRFAAQPDAPIGLLNQLFFDAPNTVKAQILRRNALAHDGSGAQAVAEAHDAALIEAARARRKHDLEIEFARLLGIDGTLVSRILGETGGEALAAACKGAHLRRATFSALALLFAPDPGERETRLAAFDTVPQEGAESLVAFWRAHRTPQQQSSAA